MENVRTGVSVRLLVTALAVVVTAVGASAEAMAQVKKRTPEKGEKGYDPDAPVLAAGGVFKCVDRDGNITYLNVGDAKGCKKIDTESVNTAPFPKASGSAPGKSTTAARTDGGAQRARDTDRKRILQEELAAEEKRLADLKKEFNNGEPERKGDEKNFQKYQDRTEKVKADVSRSESNVESLRRELGSIKD